MADASSIGASGLLVLRRTSEGIRTPALSDAGMRPHLAQTVQVLLGAPSSLSLSRIPPSRQPMAFGTELALLCRWGQSQHLRNR